MPTADSASKKWIWPVLVLAFCHAVAIASAQIVNILVDPIKLSLSISDTQFSLLQGLAVAVFAALLGIPVARLADRGNRRLVIIVGVAIWSGAIAACGFARSFPELFAARAFVGIGEVFLFPAALSLIVDLVPRARLATAIALFGCGGPIGAAAALIGGGWLVERGQGATGWLAAVAGEEPWRLAFIACAGIGLVALCLLATVREPTRQADTRTPRGFVSMLDHMRRHRRAYTGTMGGMLALSFVVFAATAWAPTLLVRDHGYSHAAAGQWTGLAALIFAVGGTWVAGIMTDRLGRAGKVDGVIRFSIIIATLNIVVLGAIGFAPTALSAGILICLAYSLLGMPTVLSGTALQQLAPPDLRAQVMAVYVLLVNLIGAGLGPTSVALINEHVFRRPDALGPALAVTSAIAGLLAIMAFLFSRRAFIAKRCRDADRLTESGWLGANLAVGESQFSLPR